METDEQIRRVTAEKHRQESIVETLLPWQSLDIPLELAETESCSILLGTMPVYANLDEVNAKLADLAGEAQLLKVSADRMRQYLFLVCIKGVLNKAWEVLREYDFAASGFQGMTGTVKENLVALRLKIKELASEKEELEAKITAESGRRDEIKLCADRMAARIAKAEAVERLLGTESVIALQGWIPASEEQKLAEVLASFDCAWETREPAEDETADVPIKLKNNRITRPLEMVTEMYSLPTYDGIDPSPLMMPFFTLFFGIMYADLGYGLLVVALTSLVLAKAKPRGGTRDLLELMFMCGIASAVIGWLTGGFFGNTIAAVAEMFGKRTPVLPSVLNFITHPLVDPMSDMITVLILSLVLGAIQIVAGMAIKAYMLIRDGHFLDALFDVGSWWLLFAGIALGAFGKGWYVCYAGVAALILTQGRAKKGIFAKLFGGIASLYDITGYLGDILSYSRLMALMLAGSVIANIVNMLGSMTGSVIGYALVFIIGHSFNMAINIVGTYVHASRLQYLEYFGKFYVDGGRAFAPLQINTKYVDIVKEEN